MRPEIDPMLTAMRSGPRRARTRRRVSWRRGIAAIVSAALGCASTGHIGALPRLAPPPADPEAECLRLGPVAGTADPFFGGLKTEAVLVESARHDALVQGQRLGATDVQLSEEPRRWPSGMFGGGQGVTVVGSAYRCTASGPATLAPVPPRAASPVAAGCTRDIECKGDRICVAGACADPVRRGVLIGP